MKEALPECFVAQNSSLFRREKRCNRGAQVRAGIVDCMPGTQKVKVKRGKLCAGAPAGIRTPNQQIMRRFEGHQQSETK
jgi:hypothetical protein